MAFRFADRFAKGIRGTARDVMVAESVDSSRLGSAYGLIQTMDSAGAIIGLTRGQPEPLLYVFAHGLKLLGGAAGGRIAEKRKRTETLSVELT